MQRRTGSPASVVLACAPVLRLECNNPYEPSSYEVASITNFWHALVVRDDSGSIFRPASLTGCCKEGGAHLLISSWSSRPASARFCSASDQGSQGEIQLKRWRRKDLIYTTEWPSNSIHLFLRLRELPQASPLIRCQWPEDQLMPSLFFSSYQWRRVRLKFCCMLTTFAINASMSAWQLPQYVW